MSDTENQPLEEEESPVFVTYYPENIPNSPKDLYRSLKDATKFLNSPEGKSSGARFKRFNTPKEARKFLECGDSSIICSISSPGAVGTEPKIKFSSVPRTEMTVLKKIMEKNEVAEFERRINENPRFLINTNGDVAAIVMEGFRMNPLHILAKTSSNEVTKSLLKHLNDLKYLLNLYETSEEDVRMRQVNIIDSFLNTPEKGSCDTPLHLAAKFGKVGIVRILCMERLLDRHVVNKEGKTALGCNCQRYHGDDKTEIEKEIRLLLQGHYVALYKGLAVRKLLVTSQYPVDELSTNETHEINRLRPLSGSCNLCAVAGPFSDADAAADFHRQWVSLGNDLKRTDADKGYEQVGRAIAVRLGVKWAERWRFLPEAGLITITTVSGLSKLEEYLKEKRAKDSSAEPKLKEHPLGPRRVLNFDDDLEEPSGSTDEFFDAVEELDDLNDSFISNFAALSINSPKAPPPDLSEFKTPPSTPPPVFTIDLIPTKLDNDLYNVLSTLDRSVLANFPTVASFVEKIEKINAKDRFNWPSVDSPRRVLQRKRLV